MPHATFGQDTQVVTSGTLKARVMESACKDNPNCKGWNARVNETVGNTKRTGNVV